MKPRKPPLEQIAFDAFKAYALDNSKENLHATYRAWQEWQAVKTGIAEPLPQYRSPI